MPEGHTIHALADRLERAFRGHEVEASSPQGRFAADAERLTDGSSSARRRGASTSSSRSAMRRCTSTSDSSACFP